MQVKSAVIAITLLAAFSAYAAEDITVKSEVDKDRVSTDEALKLTVTVSGSAGQNPEIKLPQLDEFYVGSSSKSFNFSMRAGKSVAANSLTLMLRPKREGEITIGQASVNYNGKEYKTQPIKITVVKGKLPLPEEYQPKTHPKAPYKKDREFTL